MKKLKAVCILIILTMFLCGCSESGNTLKFSEEDYNINGITFRIPNDYDYIEEDGLKYALKEFDNSSNYLYITSVVGELYSISDYNSQAFSNWNQIKQEEKEINQIKFQIFQWEIQGTPITGSNSEKYNDNKAFSCFFNVGNYLYDITMLYKDKNCSYDDFIKIIEQVKIPDEILNANTELLSDTEIDKAYTSPDNYKGMKVKISGKVFGEIERGDNYLAFQMFADAKNSEKNTVVIGIDPEIEITEDDFVIIDGVIEGSYNGNNALGGSVNALQLTAISIQKSNYKDIMSPTEKTIKVNKTLKQFGYSVTLKKVEFSPIETRLYFKIENNGTDEFNFYSFNTKILQGNKQYEEQENYEANYEAIQSEIMKGATTEGIITFPALDKNTPLEVHCEASSENWDEDIEPFVFKIK